MMYELFQVREEHLRESAFRPFDPNRRIVAAHYHKTYEGHLIGPDSDDEEVLEEIFKVFNLLHPKDFKSYSVSMADVVILQGVRRWYCDTFGWCSLTDENIEGKFPI